MAPILGSVYEWKNKVFHSLWQKYFLTLDEQNGRILLVNESRQIKAASNLKEIFLNISFHRFPENDCRLKKTHGLKNFAPFALNIPMQEVGSHKFLNKEFALESLDELETWLKILADHVGALDRFQKMQSDQNEKFEHGDLEPPSSILSGASGTNFNTRNRYGYDPMYYSLLWTSFISSEKIDYRDQYGHCDKDNQYSNPIESWAWSEQPFSFSGVKLIDPLTGDLMDFNFDSNASLGSLNSSGHSSNSNYLGGTSSSNSGESPFWSSVFGNSSSGDNRAHNHHSNHSGNSGTGRDHDRRGERRGDDDGIIGEAVAEVAVTAVANVILAIIDKND